MIFFYILFAIFILFNINKMTNSLCQQKEIPEDRQSNVFRTINILITNPDEKSTFSSGY